MSGSSPSAVEETSDTIVPPANADVSVHVCSEVVIRIVQMGNGRPRDGWMRQRKTERETHTYAQQSFFTHSTKSEEIYIFISTTEDKLPPASIFRFYTHTEEEEEEEEEERACERRARAIISRDACIVQAGRNRAAVS